LLALAPSEILVAVTDGEGSSKAGDSPTRIAHFRLLDRLGQGGMGVVYRAEDEKLRRTVALKLLADTTGSEERRQRFLREARSAAAVTHPNVAVIHAVDEADGRVYIAMELVEGESLRARLERGSLDLPTVRDLALQMAHGLAAAHDKGIVHRDLKPENVMITSSGVVKLLDFGLAKAASERGSPSGKTQVALAKTETLVTSDEGKVMGTPEYMSPEQALGEPLDMRSDVFSFGVVLYEMLAGGRPFCGASTGAVLVAIARDPPPSLRERAPQVDEATADVVMRCLAKAPEARFANAGEIVTALGGQRSAKASTGSAGALPALVHSTDRKAPRTLMRGAAVGLVVVLGLAVAGVAWRRSQPASSPAPSASAAVTASSVPAPVPCLPEAQRLFEQGVDAWESQSLWVGNSLWAQAIKADPRCGPAHLRLAMGVKVNGLPVSKARTYYADAAANRDRLSEREFAILEAIAPYFAPEPDETAGAANVRALASRFPDDALVAVCHGLSAIDVGESRDAFEHALSLRPSMGPAYGMLAGMAETRQAQAGYLERCARLAPRHVWCAEIRREGLKHASDCGALERFDRDRVALDPRGHNVADSLVDGLIANGAPAEAVFEAVRQAAALRNLPYPRLDYTEMAADVLEGDYQAAERLLLAAPEASAPDFDDRASNVARLAQVLDDTGRSRDADELVRKTLVLTRALSAPASPESLYDFYARAITGGVLTRAEVDARLGPVKAPSGRVSPDDVFMQWYARTAWLARSPVEARQALDTMPPRSFQLETGYVDYQIARLDALVGDFAAARAAAASAVRRCDSPDWSLEVPRAHFLLGEASEHTGDLDGARAAYDTVVRRWGQLRPKAVLADRARVRLKALGPPGSP
jgi:serine/threonine-protein kinase